MGKDCPAGSKKDSLTSACIEIIPAPKPSTVPPLAVVVQLRSTSPAAHADSVMVPTPALWIFVMLATLGSILALALWFVIYKRPTRHRSTSEDAELQQEKTESPAIIHPPPSERNGQAEMLQGAAWAPSSCPHMHQGAQTGTTWEERFACRDSAKHAETEGGRRLPTCSIMRKHRIPLPATELGGTALVTTKTV